jgi:hypothetical protein
MSRLINVTANDDYTLLVEFERGNKIIFNMEPLIRTLPYNRLNDLVLFRDIRLEDKAICWPDNGDGGQSMMPVRLTVDNILFAIRE